MCPFFRVETPYTYISASAASSAFRCWRSNSVEKRGEERDCSRANACYAITMCKHGFLAREAGAAGRPGSLWGCGPAAGFTALPADRVEGHVTAHWRPLIQPYSNCPSAVLCCHLVDRLGVASRALWIKPRRIRSPSFRLALMRNGRAALAGLPRRSTGDVTQAR
jgi:hypothetical protein